METHEEPHSLSYGKLAIVLGALLVLTGLTVRMSYVHLGFWNVPIALTMASLKASLVLLFFMHLKYEGSVIRYSFLGAIFFLAIMISFTFWDVAYRY